MEEVQQINEKLKVKLELKLITKKGIANYIGVSEPTIKLRLEDGKYSLEQFLKLKELV